MGCHGSHQSLDYTASSGMCWTPLTPAAPCSCISHRLNSWENALGRKSLACVIALWLYNLQQPIISFTVLSFPHLISFKIAIHYILRTNCLVLGKLVFFHFTHSFCWENARVNQCGNCVLFFPCCGDQISKFTVLELLFNHTDTLKSINRLQFNVLHLSFCSWIEQWPQTVICCIPVSLPKPTDQAVSFTSSTATRVFKAVHEPSGHWT